MCSHFLNYVKPEGANCERHKLLEHIDNRCESRTAKKLSARRDAQKMTHACSNFLNKSGQNCYTWSQMCAGAWMGVERVCSKHALFVDKRVFELCWRLSTI